MTKLLLIYPGSRISSTSTFYLFDPETGEVLSRWMCSNSNFAINDLYYKNQEKKELIDKRFGKVEIKFVDEVPFNSLQIIKDEEETKIIVDTF